MKSKTKALARGDRVQIKNRLYAVIDAKGRIHINAYDEAAVRGTRKTAKQDTVRELGEHTIRLDDIAGTVV